MFLKLSCARCSQPYQVTDQAMGKPIRCPHCQAVQVIAAPAKPAGPRPLPSPPAPAPARPAPAQAPAPPARSLPRPPVASRPLLVGGLVLALLVVVGGAVLAFSFLGSPAVPSRPQPGLGAAGPDLEAQKGPSTPALQGGDPARPGKPPSGEPVGRNEGKPLPRPAATEATLLLQLHSLDRLLAHGQVLAEATGPGRQVAMMFSLLQGQLSQTALPGINRKARFGAYVRVGSGGAVPRPIGLVPFSDEVQFLNLLRQYQCALTKNTDGTWTMTHPQLPRPVSIRLAHGYAYAPLTDAAGLGEDDLIEPGRLWVPKEDADLFASFRIDRLPEGLRSQYLSQLKQIKPLLGFFVASDSPEQRAYVEGATDWLYECCEDLLQGGQDLSFRLDLDAKTRAVVAELSLAGKPGSRLAGGIASLAEVPSVAGELVAAESAFSLLVHIWMPEHLRRLWAPTVHGLTEKTFQAETDPVGRREAERLIRALEPTIAAGELDFGVALRSQGVGKPATGLGGVRCVRGQELDKVFREAAAQAPEWLRPLFHLDATRPVHRLELQKLPGDTLVGQAVGQTLGRNPGYLAFREDAVFWTSGADSQQAIEAALKSAPQKASLLKLEINLRQLIELVALHEEEKALARRCFTEAQPGRVRLTLAGGEALRLRGSLDLSCLRFAAELLGVQVGFKVGPANR